MKLFNMFNNEDEMLTLNSIELDNWAKEVGLTQKEVIKKYQDFLMPIHAVILTYLMSTPRIQSLISYYLARACIESFELYQSYVDSVEQTNNPDPDINE